MTPVLRGSEVDRLPPPRTLVPGTVTLWNSAGRGRESSEGAAP